jgi:acetylornithine deacetylase/succinyl-diaminopimelate desuccinylase-like protein
MTSEQTRDLSAAVAHVLPRIRADLEDLVRIPSVGADPARAEDVRRSAAATALLFEAEGLDTQLVEINGGMPAVIARKPAPPGMPTVLLYAHHDVQPEGSLRDWHQDDPFEPIERDGRLYGRGAADDKAGVAAHLAAIRVHGDALPVGVTVFIEGEEENGSASLPAILDEYHDVLACDVMVIADSGNWDIGVPALTTSLRGNVKMEVEVRALEQGVHSGMWGGAVPDALTGLCRLLGTLHDDAGNVAVAGLHSGKAADLELSEERVRSEAGVLDGVELIGSGSLVERLWTRPALSVIGLDTTSIEASSNTLIPSARAILSLRIAPGEDGADAERLLADHLRSNAPWGMTVDVTPLGYGQPFVIDAKGPVYDAARAAFREAWDGTEPVDIGVGGSIPFIEKLAARFSDAAVLVTGVEDPRTAAHGPNESLHLGEFARVCLAEALLLAKLADL